MKKTLAFWIFLCSSLSANAEYRAFLLRIAKRADPQDYRLVISTLDPLQYPGYHPLKPDELITYDDTWLCRGHTGYEKPICSNPKSQPDQESGPINGPEN